MKIEIEKVKRSENILFTIRNNEEKQIFQKLIAHMFGNWKCTTVFKTFSHFAGFIWVVVNK